MILTDKEKNILLQLVKMELEDYVDDLNVLEYTSYKELEVLKRKLNNG